MLHLVLPRWVVCFLIGKTCPSRFCAVQVGSGRDEHRVWARPEDMLRNKVRIGHKIDKHRPGSDVVGSTAAALASASIVFKKSNPRLVIHTHNHHCRTVNNHALEYLIR